MAMTIKMDLKEARFTLTDVIKIMAAVIMAAFAWFTLQSSVSNVGTKIESVSQSVSEIRETQIENTKKNEARWNLIDTEIQQLKMSQKLFEQRLTQLENKK